MISTKCVQKCCFAWISVPYQSNQRSAGVSDLSFLSFILIIFLQSFNLSFKKCLSILNSLFLNLQLRFSLTLHHSFLSSSPGTHNFNFFSCKQKIIWIKSSLHLKIRIVFTSDNFSTCVFQPCEFILHLGKWMTSSRGKYHQDHHKSIHYLNIRLTFLHFVVLACHVSTWRTDICWLSLISFSCS